MLHATLVAVFLPGKGWRGVLLSGPSGAGKSDLALRCLDAGWRIVADDRVIVWRAQDRLFGRPPPALAGLIELRGQGMAKPRDRRFAEIVASVRLAPPSDRQPEPAWEAIAGVSLATRFLAPLHASAPARLRRIVEGLEP